MSSVLLFVGQCGIQVGSTFSQFVTAEGNCDVYSSYDGDIRGVYVDSESKVIQAVCKQPHVKIQKTNIVSGKRGCGNNWALGFHGRGSDAIAEQSIAAIRKEAENLCGGTGSGMGSRLCRDLRDDLGLPYILSCVVAPHAQGESPLQQYNGLLCLSQLQRHSDGIVLLHNDEVLRRVQRSRREQAEKQVDMCDINQHLGRSLAQLLSPVTSLTPKCGWSLGQEPWELIRSACPNPDTKFLHLNSVSKQSGGWEALTSALGHQLLPMKYHRDKSPCATLAGVCVARGGDQAQFSVQQPALDTRLRHAYSCLTWNPFPFDYWTDKVNFEGRKKVSLTAATNHSSVTDFLQDVTSRARQKYDSGAYLHWFWKHGAEKSDFVEAFEDVSTIVQDYNQAVS